MAAFYRAGVADFLRDDADRIVGQLAAGWGDTGFNELKQQQLKAWKLEISVLSDSLRALTAELPAATRWTLLLEYSIPRRQRRIDAVLLAGDLIFCVEFKTKDKAHSRAAERQVEDYALDLRDFHEESCGRQIIPIVVVPKAPAMLPNRRVVRTTLFVMCDWQMPVTSLTWFASLSAQNMTQR